MSDSDERRGAYRLLRNEAVIVKITGSPASPELVGVTVECSSVDLSATGLRLLLECAVTRGAQLAMEVELADTAQRYLLAGEVRWSQQTEVAGIYLVGVQIIDADADDAKRWASQFF